MTPDLVVAVFALSMLFPVCLIAVGVVRFLLR